MRRRDDLRPRQIGDGAGRYHQDKAAAWYTAHMDFEWDESKAIDKLAKHGVAFTEAATVLYDPLSLTFADPDHSADEDRFITMGMSDQNRLLIVAHTERGDTVRIISARPITARERKLYESGS